MYAAVRKLLVLVLLASVLIVSVTPLAAQDGPGPRRLVMHTIDFSAHGEGLLQPAFFRNEGIEFSPVGGVNENYWVGYIQGDQALVTNVFASFQRPIWSLSVSVAPGFQGPMNYTLTAYSPSGSVVATTTVVANQPPFGYFTIDLGRLPRNAKSFSLIVTSGSYTSSMAGVSSITFGQPGGS